MKWRYCVLGLCTRSTRLARVQECSVRVEHEVKKIKKHFLPGRFDLAGHLGESSTKFWNWIKGLQMCRKFFNGWNKWSVKILNIRIHIKENWLILPESKLQPTSTERKTFLMFESMSVSLVHSWSPDIMKVVTTPVSFDEQISVLMRLMVLADVVLATSNTLVWCSMIVLWPRPRTNSAR